MPLHDINAILDRIDLEAVADELCGPRRGHGSRARWPSPVPGHPQTGKTPPMSIFTDRRGRQRWTCWATGTSGTAIDLVSVNRRMDISSSITWLADRSGRVPEPVRRTPRPTAPKRTGASAALRDYVHACVAELYKPSGEGARRWLERRCLNPDVLELNDVGLDPGPNELRRARGLPNRGPGIVLPTFDRLGQLVYAQTRYFDPEAAGRKYDNPSGKHATKPAVSWPHLLDSSGRQTIVCEGVIDALTVAGLPMQAVAILSASDAAQAVSELASVAGSLVLALDPDPAGRTSGDRLRTSLGERGRHDVRRITLPSDLNDLAQTLGDGFKPFLSAAVRTPPRVSPLIHR